jgi:hypothetical protein
LRDDLADFANAGVGVIGDAKGFFYDRRQRRKI